MQAKLLRGPLLLLLYQAVPVQAARDSLGRHRIAVGYGMGQWEHEVFNCNGEFVRSAKIPYHSAGLEIDEWMTPRFRITGFGGTYRPTVDADTPDYAGPFGGAQAAFEGQHFGIGVGFTHLSGSDGGTAPSVYLRGGNLDGVHFRTDFLPPTATLGSIGMARIGAGFGDGHLRRTSGFLGIALGPYSDKAALTGSIRFFIANGLAVQADGIVGPGRQYGQGGAALALRYDFGR